MPTEYTAQILQLLLPEQNDLKDKSERCSADPVKLESMVALSANRFESREATVPGSLPFIR